jgi:LPS export ABC transporter protein LptC
MSDQRNRAKSLRADRTGFPLFIHCLWLIVYCSLFSCEDEKPARKTVAAYVGPIEQIDNVRMLYSEGAMLKVKLITASQYRYANDDKRFPRQVNISFYDPTGQETTTIRSDSGRYARATDLYTVMGHVVVINKLKQEKLLTPELTWNPNTKKVATTKRVQVLSQLTGERLYGLGLDANQDFSQYSIRKPTGVFNVE